MPRKLKLFTDCSGMETPAYTLGKMSIDYELIGSSEPAQHCITFAAKNFPSQRHWTDMTTRADEELERPCDLYVCGFPCQPFSAQGHGKGFKDKKRGGIFKHVVRTITKMRPRAFILENVSAITRAKKQKKPEIETVMKKLRSIGGYACDYQEIDTRRHGVPHSRPRVYIVGVSGPVDTTQFWPPSLPPQQCPPLSALLEPHKAPASNRESLANFMKKNILSCEIDIRCLDKRDPSKSTYGIAVDNSFERCNFMFECSPCLMHSHPDGPFLTTHNRRAEAEEQSRLQGFIPADLHLNIDATDFCRMLGNGMSVNVLERILCRVLPLANLVDEPPIDRWQSGIAIRELVDSVGSTFRSS